MATANEGLERKDPLITVFIPTYNMGTFIKDAVLSALEQDYANFEVIVSDNCSTDDTEEILKSVEDQRFSYFRNDKNLGIFGNVNRALELSNGEYIFYFCADDIISPVTLRTYVSLINKNPEKRILGIKNTYENNLEKGEILQPNCQVVNHKNFIDSINSNISFGLSGLCVSSKVLRDRGGFLGGDGHALDIINVFSMIMDGEEYIFITEKLYWERPHDNQNRFSYKVSNKLIEHFDFVSKYYAKLTSTKSDLEGLNYFLNRLIAQYYITFLRFLKFSDLIKGYKVCKQYGYSSVPLLTIYRMIAEKIKMKVKG